MAIGAKDLATKNVIVKKLTAIEELSGVDVLASDKTGTLTKNHLTIGKLFAFNNFSTKDVLMFASLCSRKEDNDPIDNAILEDAKKMNLLSTINKFKVNKFIPFDPIIKRTIANVEFNGKIIKVTKGAPQVVLELCNPPEELKKKILKIIDELANDGYRALGVAIQKNNKWHFIGLISFFDPPRDDAKEAIKELKSLNVKVKMITGDHIAIAKNIAKILGIGNKIINLKSLMDNFKDKKINQMQLDRIIENADGFAEVFPEHKYDVVVSLQRKGHFVAMTGDGVNDAPALKAANCGIAVSNATDAARSASDIVLLTPGISVINDAIKEARRIFARMENYAIYRITETIRLLIFVTWVILILKFYPLNPIMVALLVILNDIPLLAISYDNVIESKKPTNWKLKPILMLSTALGLVGVVSSFIIFYYGYAVLKLSKEMLQTLIFLKLILAGHSTLFITRNKKWFWKKPFPSEYLFSAIILTDIIGTLIAANGIFVAPIGWKLTLFVWIYVIAWMFINDTVKVLLLKKIKY